MLLLIDVDSGTPTLQLKVKMTVQLGYFVACVCSIRVINAQLMGE